jgi:hypothetical protein
MQELGRKQLGRKRPNKKHLSTEGNAVRIPTEQSLY